MRKISVLLILMILSATLITGCNYASAPTVEPSAETAVESSAPVTEQETNETANIENLAPVTKPADTSESPITEPQQGGEGASSPSMAPDEQESTTDNELCGYPLAEPVTTAFEMYMQYYDEKGNIIEIPQILDDSPAAEAINRELREIGDEYYREYIDGFVGNHTCQVIAYPCETEDYLSIVIVEKELPEDRDNDGEVESWVYARSLQMQRTPDMGYNTETIEAAMPPGMKFEEIEDIEYRPVDNGYGEHYITIEYSIDGREYEGLFIMRDGRMIQYTGGSVVPSYAVANFPEPLWAKWEENHNRLYDTTESDEKIAQVGDEIKTLARRELDLLIDADEMFAAFSGTSDIDGHYRCLVYQVYTENNGFNSFGIFYYDVAEDAYYGPLTASGEAKRLDK